MICAKRNKQGFTLIEVMIVIVIMGILATIAVPNTYGVIERVRENIDKLKLFYLRDALNRSLVENELAMFDSPYLSQGSEKDQKTNKNKLDSLLKQPSGVTLFVYEVKPGAPANIQASHGYANDGANMSRLIGDGGTWYYALKESGFEGVADIVAYRLDKGNDTNIGNDKNKSAQSFNIEQYGYWRTFPKTPLFVSREMNYGKSCGLVGITSQTIGKNTNTTNYRLTMSVQWTNRDPDSRSVEVAFIPNGGIMNDGTGHGSAFMTEHGVCFSTYGPSGCANYRY